MNDKNEVLSEVRVTLHHGDVAVMLPGCQEEWTHEVPAGQVKLGDRYRGKEDRINYTFRMDRMPSRAS